MRLPSPLRTTALQPEHRLQSTAYQGKVDGSGCGIGDSSRRDARGGYSHLGSQGNPRKGPRLSVLKIAFIRSSRIGCSLQASWTNQFLLMYPRGGGRWGSWLADHAAHALGQGTGSRAAGERGGGAGLPPCALLPRLRQLPDTGHHGGLACFPPCRQVSPPARLAKTEQDCLSRLLVCSSTTW